MDFQQRAIDMIRICLIGCMFGAVDSQLGAVDFQQWQIQSHELSTVAVMQATPLANMDFVTTAGYTTVGDGGGNKYQYHSTGRPTADGGFFIDGSGADDYLEAVDKTIANALQFGAKRDWVNPTAGTDDEPAITAMNAAAVAQNSTIVIPPGDYKIASYVSFPGSQPLKASGAQLVYTGSTFTGAICTIGTSGVNSAQVRFEVPDVKHNSIAHAFQNANFACIRFMNLTDCDIVLGRYSSADIGIQLKPEPGRPVVHCRFTNGSVGVCKTMVEIRGETSTGFVNENSFYDLNLTSSSSMTNWGSVYGVKFTSEPGGYEGHNNNRFYSTSFQVGDREASEKWSNGGAVTLNYRFEHLENEYEVTNIGSGTFANEPPVHTGAPVTDANGVELTYVGLYYKIPVYHDEAGGSNAFENSRWETGFGPFALIEQNATQTVRWNEYEAYSFVINDWTTAHGSRAIDTWSLNTVDGLGHGNNAFKIYGQQTLNDSVEIKTLNMRAINSGANSMVAGVSFMNFGSFAPTLVGTNAAIICNDRIKFSGGNSLAGVFIRTNRLKQFTVHIGTSQDTLSRIRLKAFDESFSPLTHAISDFAFIGHSSQVISDDTAATGSDGIAAVDFVIPDGSLAAWMAVMVDGRSHLQDLRIEAISDSMQRPASSTDFAGTLSFRNRIDTQRNSFGTPDAGIFPEIGEYIGNADGALAVDGWTVKTAGALAPAWGPGDVVLIGELRSNAGHVYSAASAGTTDNPGTAPVHTSGSTTDGLIVWDYYSTEAVLAVQNTSNVVTPEQFGAVGDGVTDDSVALQAMLSSSALNIQFDSKSYVTDASLTSSLAGRVINLGGGTLLQGDAAATILLSVSGNGTTVRNGTIQGDGSGTTPIMLQFTGADDCTASHLTVKDSADMGIQFVTCERPKADHITCSGNHGGGSSTFSGNLQLSQCSFGQVSNVTVTESLGKGVSFSGSDDCTVDGLSVERAAYSSDSDGCLYITEGSRNRASNIYGKNSHIKVSKNTFDTIISDFQIETSGFRPMFLQGAVDVKLQNGFVDTSNTPDWGAIVINQHPTGPVDSTDITITNVEFTQTGTGDSLAIIDGNAARVKFIGCKFRSSVAVTNYGNADMVSDFGVMTEFIDCDMEYTGSGIPDVYADQAGGVVLRNTRVVQNTASATAAHIRTDGSIIEGGYYETNDQYGIRLVGATMVRGVDILNVNANASGEVGIRMDAGGASSRIIDCTIDAGTGTGIWMTAADCENIVVENCEIDGIRTVWIVQSTTNKVLGGRLTGAVNVDGVQSTGVNGTTSPGPHFHDARAYAGISAVNNATATTIPSSSVDWSNKVQVTIFGTNNTAELNATADHTNDHVLIDLAGDYSAHVSMSLTGTTGDTVSYAVFKNNGAVLACIEGRITLTGNKDTVSLSPCPMSLVSPDTMEVWIQNETFGRDVTVEEAGFHLHKIN